MLRQSRQLLLRQSNCTITLTGAGLPWLPLSFDTIACLTYLPLRRRRAGGLYFSVINASGGALRKLNCSLHARGQSAPIFDTMLKKFAARSPFHFRFP